MKITNYIKWILLTLGSFVFILVTCHGEEMNPQTIEFPLHIHSYGDAQITDLWNILKHRVEVNPFNLIATLIFFCAIIHTFMATRFERLAGFFKKKHKNMLIASGRENEVNTSVCFKSELCHFFGEIEAIFAIWLVPLVIVIIYFFGWKSLVGYIDGKVNYTEPMFVVVIMAIASTRPILKLAENCLKIFAKIGKCSSGAWWLSILIIAPLLGSFITEPAAMTIAALLLARQFYNLKPPAHFCYATLGLLFVNISVGGTLTHFAAPPVLMVANVWNWDTPFMFLHFGDRAVTGIIIATAVYYFVFRKEFRELDKKVRHQRDTNAPFVEGESVHKKEVPVPMFISFVHVIFLAWTVFTLHHPPLFIGGFLFFLAFTQVTMNHQNQLHIRGPLLVGLFLAGLVTHGGLQQWWIQPVLHGLSELPLFIGATVLTAFNDNAAITFLATLVPSFEGNIVLQKAIVAGAVTGGGLTVIANAPNPAGQSILSHYFEGGVSPLKLLLSALFPTVVMALSFMLF